MNNKIIIFTLLALGIFSGCSKKNDANYVNIENNVLEKINNYCVFLKKVAKFQIFNEIVEDFKWIK